MSSRDRKKKKKTPNPHLVHRCDEPEVDELCRNPVSPVANYCCGVVGSELVFDLRNETKHAGRLWSDEQDASDAIILLCAAVVVQVRIRDGPVNRVSEDSLS